MASLERSASVVSLTNERAERLALTGGKGANLAKLNGAGLPVPDGVCVTTTVYERLVDGDPRASIDDLVRGATRHRPRRDRG